MKVEGLKVKLMSERKTRNENGRMRDGSGPECWFVIKSVINESLVEVKIRINCLIYLCT